MSPLRLLIVTDAIGGVWIYSIELAHALKALGVESVLAVTGPSPGAQQREAAADFTLIDTGLPLEWLDTGPDAIARAGAELARIAAREHADLVQVNSAALIAAGDFPCPCIAVQHSCVATWWSAVKGTPLPDDFAWRRELVARGLARAEAIVAPSKAFAAATANAYGIEGAVQWVHNGRSPRQARTLPQGDFVFTAGRLWDEGKNVAVLDRAASRIHAPVQAAGSAEGPNGARVELDHIAVLGQLSESRMAGVLAARPVYASAALYEPFGLAVLEAAQAGCALVLSDIDTHRELWDGVATFVDPRDDGGFADAVNRLLADREERNRLGARAREHARRFTPEATASAMAQIYAGAMEHRPQLVAGAA